MLFFLTCLYMLVLYFQPGNRIPGLEAVRFEFFLGIALLMLLFATRWNRIFTNEHMTKAAFFFFAGMMLSFIGAVQTHTASDAFEIFNNLLKSFSIYLMIVGTVDSKEKLEKFLWVYVACMVILIGEPFLLSLRGENMYAKENGVVRLYGVGQFAHPNGLGINAVTTLPILYFFFWRYRSYLVKVSLAGFALVCLRVMMLAGSRTAYVGLIVLAMCLFLYSKRKARFAVVTCLLGVVALASVPDMYRDRFISLKEVVVTIDEDEEATGSIEGRWELIQDAWRTFLKYPVFGCGMDSFRRLPIDMKEYNTHGQTHNLLMQCLAETGLVGMITFGFLLLSIWKSLVSTKHALSHSAENMEYLCITVEALQVLLILKLCIGMIAQHSLYSNIWWLIGGLAVVMSRIVAQHAGDLTFGVLPVHGNLDETYQTLSSTGEKSASSFVS